MSDAQFFRYGWRIPVPASAVLVLVGLFVRLRITETPAVQKVLDKNERVRVPVVTVFRDHGRMLFLGTIIALATFVLFYLMPVFALSWGTTALGYSRPRFLQMQLFAVLFSAMTIPLSAVLADSYGRRETIIVVSIAIVLFGLAPAPTFGSGSVVEVTLFMCLGLALMDMTYGPLGTMLSDLFPAEVPDTGSLLTFNFAGILGASLAPYIATWLASNYGLAHVGYHLSIAALLTLAALLMTGASESGKFAE